MLENSLDVPSVIPESHPFVPFISTSTVTPVEEGSTEQATKLETFIKPKEEAEGKMGRPNGRYSGGQEESKELVKEGKSIIVSISDHKVQNIFNRAFFCISSILLNTCKK